MWKICLLACCVCLALAACAQAPVQENSTAPELPLAGLVVCVDPGHGGYDGGARARESLVWESEINLRVSMKLSAALRAAGAECVLTRDTDKDLAPAGAGRKRRDLLARLEIAKEAQADVYLSVHMNEYRSRAESGPQVFYRAGTAGEGLAGTLQASLIAWLKPARERAAQAGDYLVLSLGIPSALIECGFLSNAREEALLLDDEYQERIARAVCDGLIAWRTSGV